MAVKGSCVAQDCGRKELLELEEQGKKIVTELRPGAKGSKREVSSSELRAASEGQEEVSV